MLRSLRRTHDFPMPKARAALRFTGEKLGARRPLIEETFYSDGVNLLVERLASVIDTAGGQTVMRGVLADSLRRVERGTDGRVVRFYPWLNEPTEVRAVEIDPDRAFGRLVLVGTVSRRKRSPSGSRRGTTSTFSRGTSSSTSRRFSRRSGGSSARRVRRNEVVFFVDRCLV